MSRLLDIEASFNPLAPGACEGYRELVISKLISRSNILSISREIVII